MNTFLNYLGDSILVSGLLIGGIGTFLISAVVVWRMFGGALDFIARNSR